MLETNYKDIEAIKVGDQLPEMNFTVTQEHINQYAEASGDFNPLHIDEEFAKTTIFEGTIAHGLMTLAFVSQMMTKVHWRGWMYGGKLDVTFITPVRPDDTVLVGGEVIEINKEENEITVKLNVRNTDEEKIIVGKANYQLKEEG